jgi:hypothetical protein
MARPFIATLAFALLAAYPVAAQGGPPAGKRTFDPATVETVQGQVVSIQYATHGAGPGAGVHVQLKTDAGETTVMLGPRRYVDAQPLKLAAGDQISVHGSRMTIGGKPAIVAISVTKGDQTMRLREDSGVPLWSRGARRR